MSDSTNGKEKPREGANFGQGDPSPAKVQAAHDRAVLEYLLGKRCKECPFAPGRCAWMCTVHDVCWPAEAHNP